MVQMSWRRSMSSQSLDQCWHGDRKDLVYTLLGKLYERLLATQRQKNTYRKQQF